MKSLQTLAREFDAKNTERKALAEKGEGLTADDVVRMQTLVGEMEGLKTQIEAVRAAGASGDALEQWAGQSAGAPLLPVDAGTGLPLQLPGGAPAPSMLLGMAPAGDFFMETTAKGIEVVNTGAGIMTKKQWDTVRQPEYATAWWKNIRGGLGSLTHTEIKALQEGNDGEGGFLAPEQILNRVVQKEPTPNRLAGMVSPFTTIRDTLALPRVVYSTDDLYTTGMRVTWTGENPASSTAHRVTQPGFGMIRIPVYTAMMSILVTNDLLEDSIVMLQGWLESKFFETIELLRDNMILNGTGTSQPSGILQNPGGTDEPATVVSGDADELTADGLQSLGWSLPEQYDENGRFVFNKTNTGQAIAKLKDGEGRYLWGAGLQDSGLVPGIRNRELLGYPVAFSGFAPNIGANAYPIVFGDLRGYYLVNRVGFSVQVLRELYAETNQVLLLGRVRFGGDVAEPWRMKIQKVAAA